jgi:hypothetical protein
MTQDPKVEADPQALNRLRARRDEVEQALHDGGWRFDGIKEPLRRWWRRGAVVFTPSDSPSLDTAEEWSSLLDRTAAIAVNPIGTVADSPKHAPHDAARDWAAALVSVESSEIPTPEALRVERAEAKAEIDRLQAALDDAEVLRKAGDEGYRMVERESREACHLLQLLGVKPGFLPDMIAASLPPERRLLLRIRNESQTRLAVDNLRLQQVAEDDPRMVEAVAAYREAVALRMAAEPARDHSPEVGNMVEP